MCVTYSVSWCKLATRFSTFSIFILSDRNGKSLWILYNFSIYETSASTKYPSSLSSSKFFMKSSWNWEASSIHSNYLLEAFATLANHTNYLHMTIPLIYLLLAFAYRWIAWHIPPLMPFSIINSIST